MGPEEADRSQSCATRHYISEIVDAFESDPVKFVQQIVTGDKIWVHHWDPESKVESMQWRHASSSPKEVQNSTLCWETHGDHFLGQ